jgi:hypothetical protein
MYKFKQLNFLALVAFISLTIYGCDNVLSEKPLNSITGETVWSNSSLMQAYLNGIYQGMGEGFEGVTMMSSMSDESMFTHNQGTFSVVQSNINPSNLKAFHNGRYKYLQWDNLYANIRKTNIFLKKTGDYSGTDKAKVKIMRGQAYFLRAYFYHQLMRLYGGVPLITKVYSLQSKKITPPRNSFKETIDFIVADADSAEVLLPLSYSNEANLGRATKGAAMALKSRVLLYASSDLYNVNPSGMPETGYTSATSSQRQERWKKDQVAAKAVIDLGIYHLYKANPASDDSTAKNYEDLFLSKDNSEIIMAHYFSLQQDGLWGGYAGPALGNGLNGSDGYAGNTPLEQMVDSYEMKDGSKFSWKNPKEAAHPYQNRDPRFYATILYDGAHWRKRYEDGQKFDPYGIVQTFSTLILPDGSTLPGIDTRSGPIQNWNGSYTHYYLRKFIDPDVDYLKTQQVDVPWPYFRYAEILLNYAEASIELGQDGKARNVLNKIRKRVGMPKFGASLTGKKLMDEYRNERRVEMAFEEQRFYDIRRWMIAPQVMNQNGQGIEITVHGKSRPERSTYHNYQYKVINVQDRNWNDKMYFLPINLDEMNRNKNLVQNPGY